MHRLLRVLALLACASLCVGADFQAGKRACDQGDYAGALKQWLPIAKQGNQEAQVCVGFMYATGKGVPPSIKQALPWFRLSAKAGNPRAEFVLGQVYARGLGVRQSNNEAAKWYLVAAEHGLAEAQFAIGHFYQEGMGVRQDYAEAAVWLRRAATQGHLEARTFLGLQYAQGQGVPQDYAEALTWLSVAAEQGSAAAQLAMSLMYSGLGAENDPAKAHMWLQLAAENSAPEAPDAGFWSAARPGDITKLASAARQEMESMEAGMSADQLHEAQEMAAEWRAQRAVRLTAAANSATGGSAPGPREGLSEISAQVYQIADEYGRLGLRPRDVPTWRKWLSFSLTVLGAALDNWPDAYSASTRPPQCFDLSLRSGGLNRFRVQSGVGSTGLTDSSVNLYTTSYQHVGNFTFSNTTG